MLEVITEHPIIYRRSTRPRELDRDIMHAPHARACSDIRQTHDEASENFSVTAHVYHMVGERGST